MNLAQVFKRMTDALWLVGGIGAAAELGLDGIGPEDFGPDKPGSKTPGPAAHVPGATSLCAPGSSARRPGGNQGHCVAPGGEQTLRVGHA